MDTARLATRVNLGFRLLTGDFVRKVAAIFGAKLIGVALAAISTIVVARVLGPQGRGLFALATTVTGIGIQFGLLGLHSANTYFVARDRNVLSSLFGNSVLVGFVIGTVIVGVSSLVCLFAPELMPISGTLLVLALLAIPFGIVQQLLQAILIGIQQIGDYNKADLVKAVSAITLIAMVVLCGWASPAAICSAVLCGTLLGLGVTARLLCKYLPVRPVLSSCLFKSSFRYGFKVYLSCLFMYFVLRLDLIMVDRLLDAKQAGFYSIAVALADQLYLLPTVAATVLFPKLTSIDSAAARLAVAKKSAAGVALIMVGLTSIAAILATPLVQLLFGDEFLPCVPALIWLLPGLIMLSVNSILMNYFASNGLPLAAIVSPLCALVVNIWLNALLIPEFGIVGAAFASTVAYGLMLLFSLCYLAVVPLNEQDCRTS